MENTYGSVTRVSQGTERSVLKSILCILAYLFSQRARRPQRSIFGPPKITDSTRKGQITICAIFENQYARTALTRNMELQKNQKSICTDRF